ncbi:branched-chain alpha-keto acid dehydrogenase E1 alpha subunit [Staphylococcus gallinarum]|uniref:Branched-chain alpha-keto acid dehydrogenase E1 alpha subunit n=1 Tax=Staphylococcus gallinarum TaxID=1293 RepID=A0A380FJ18_STAGA|nr:branched-chain alpha-keto acid dehydrogenase E1 alpha subunit [Staphylococcus gallinarum]
MVVSTLIEAMCTRLTAHSSDDDDKYRSKEERDELKSLDCNIKFKEFLLEEGVIDNNWLDEIEKEHKENCK